MSTIERNIENYILETVSSLGFSGDIEVNLQSPNDSSYGDYTTNVAMQLAGAVKKNPRELAEEIVESLEAMEEVEKVEVAGPGFINFTLKTEVHIHHFNKLFEDHEVNLDQDLADKRIMVEFAHPNPFKIMHVGHLRNIILGEAIVRVLEAKGAEVIRTNYQGDVGMHIAKCLWALKEVDPRDYPESLDDKVKLIGEMYSKGATAYKEDKIAHREIREINKKIYSQEDENINQLWELGKEWSIDKFHEIYDRLDSHFQREYMESEVIEDGLENAQKALECGILEESDGAVIFNGEKYGLDTRVFINSDGLPTYEGKELGLAPKEFTDFGDLDLCIHNVAVAQESFFRVTFKVQELLWPELVDNKQYHNPYEFVGLKKGKMSSRLGNVISADDVLDEAESQIKQILGKTGDLEGNEINEIAEKLAVAAVKFSFLKISAFKHLAFDMEESVRFEGFSGPYVMYMYVRANSIVQKSDLELSSYDIQTIQDLNESEMSLIKKINEFPIAVGLAQETYSMHSICQYLYELAKEFSVFYENNSVLTAETDEKKQLRLKLTQSVAQIIKEGMYLLGIDVVEKM
jgi:arginyl-tRNA synthetase